MNRLTLMSALFLTACGSPDPIIPAELTRRVVVTCPPGYTSGALGACLIELRQGLNIANDKLRRIEEISSPSAASEPSSAHTAVPGRA